jgi:hypothetical protein
MQGLYIRVRFREQFPNWPSTEAEFAKSRLDSSTRRANFPRMQNRRRIESRSSPASTPLDVGRAYHPMEYGDEHVVVATAVGGDVRHSYADRRQPLQHGPRHLGRPIEQMAEVNRDTTGGSCAQMFS